jgi:hypothetical protein
MDANEAGVGAEQMVKVRVLIPERTTLNHSMHLRAIRCSFLCDIVTSSSTLSPL